MSKPLVDAPLLRSSILVIVSLSLLSPLTVSARSAAELEHEVAKLQRELEQKQRELERAKSELAKANEISEKAHKEARQAKQREMELRTQFDQRAPVEEPKIEIGPITVGGAIRASYVYGSYVDDDPGDGPRRGSNGGNLELDTFRINLTLDHENWLGAFEYRWYSDYGKSFPASYNFIHTAWLGYRFGDDSHIEAGVNRVPFGAGPYGVAQSYMFDMNYYLGLADDMDLGIKYSTRKDDWKLDFAYYPRSEGSYFGRSTDSTRYSFDAVRWNESVDGLGNLIYGGAENGYEERNQFNMRAIRLFEEIEIPTELGFSLQYGQLEGTGVDDGDHWAASLHMVNTWNNWKLGTQVSRYEYNIDDDNPWGSDALIPMGAFDFAWFTATRAWVPAISLSYEKSTPSIPWLQKVVPYIEYSQQVKDEDGFNDSKMFSLGAQWYSGNWLVYTDLVYANGNWFIGNEDKFGNADDYSRIDGVGDWGANGNDHWNYRFTINLGYYF